jgi:hypothetical protein
MKTITKIVSEFGQKGHPLGKSIYRDEVPSLISRLRQRLGMSQSELDLTPASLKSLEDKLFEKTQKKWGETYNEEEIVQFVREISAYVGEVLVLNAGCEWEPLGTLWSTHIVIKGNVKVTKEGRSRIVPSVAIPLGAIGATALEMVSAGQKPLLYKEYVSAKKKMFKEELKKSKSE